MTVRALSDRLAPDPGMAVGHWLAGLDAADEQGHVTFNERGRVSDFQAVAERDWTGAEHPAVLATSSFTPPHPMTTTLTPPERLRGSVT